MARRTPSRTPGASASASAGASSSAEPTAAAAGAAGRRIRTSLSTLSRTTAFRFHADKSKDPSDHDDEYRTLTLHADGTFTDYNEHLWDLKSGWVTEGVNRIVYAGTYTLDLPPVAGSQVQLRYTKVVSKTKDVVHATESLEAEEPLEEPVVIYGTLSAAGKRSLTVKPYRGGEAAEPQTLTVKARPYIYGGKYC